MRAGVHRQDLFDHVGAALLRHRAPVVLGQQVQHLVAVAQLLRHHAQDPELLLLVLGPGKRQAVLLDGAELGRRLGADRSQHVMRLLGDHLRGAVELGLALHLAALDLGAHAELPVGAELEPGVVREVLVPVLEQEVVIGQESLPPAHHGVMEALRKAGRPGAHLVPRALRSGG